MSKISEVIFNSKLLLCHIYCAFVPGMYELPVCDRIHFEEPVCIHHKILMGTKADMDLIASAIKKIYDNADELK